MFRLVNFAYKSAGARFVVETRWGGRFACDPRDFIERMICNFGVWEPDVTALAEDLLADGDVVIDVGANIGYFTVLARRRVGPAGRVAAIEPHPIALERLGRNLALNDIDDVLVVRAAVAAAEGEVTLFGGPADSLGESALRPGGRRTELGAVRAAPLTALVPADLLARARLVKIDVEGGEAAVLDALLDDIDALSPRLAVLVEIDPAVEASRAAFARMLAAGFRAFAIRNDYDDRAYLDWRAPAPPLAIDRPPEVQTDVLFERGPADQPVGQAAPGSTAE